MSSRSFGHSTGIKNTDRNIELMTIPRAKNGLSYELVSVPCDKGLAASSLAVLGAGRSQDMIRRDSSVLA